MGYKSVLRSINSSVKASARKSERKQRQLERERARFAKRIEELEEKKSKVVDSLNDLLAKGKIDQKKYTKLRERGRN